MVKKCSRFTACFMIQSRSVISISAQICITMSCCQVVPQCSRTTSCDWRKSFKIWFLLVSVSRSMHPRTVNILFSSVAQFWPAYLLLRTCGSLVRSTTRLVPLSPIGNVCELLFWFFKIKEEFRVVKNLKTKIQSVSIILLIKYFYKKITTQSLSPLFR